MAEFGLPGALASGNSAGVENVQFAQIVEIVLRKILIIATYDPLLTSVVEDVPFRIFNANEAGIEAGDGFMAHRLAIRAFEGSQGAETWMILQGEAGGGAQAVGDIDFTGSTGVVAGQLFLYIAGVLVAAINLIAGETDDDIALKVVAAVTADKTLPVTAAVNGGTLAQVDFTSKSEGLWGNDITLAFNLRARDESPVGVLAVITDMASGAGTPDVQTALDGLGTGDNQNENFFTDVICGYGQDTSTLDKISVYNGVGNDFVGNYSKTVARAFRALVGDTVPGTGALTTLISAADGRAELDRTNGVIGAPGEFYHPMEIAASVVGIMARTNNLRAQDNYVNKIIPNMPPTSLGSDRWTNDYTLRDDAIRNGVGTTQVKNLTLTVQDVISFYRPAAVVPESNGYRSMRNIAIIQNLEANNKANFERAFWQNITIVEDSNKVTDNVDQEKVRDRTDAVDDVVNLARLFGRKAWFFTADFTIQRLKSDPSLVTVLTSGRGFKVLMPGILSGEGGIFDNTIQFDVSLTILAQN